ncbi:MAG TPA: sulfurtransferase TusA family protein [Chloroflexia bacterium]|jgi:TusA-related sulfurtransferase
MSDNARQVTNTAELPLPDAVLEVSTKDADSGFICASLTPLIKSKLREMEGGQVLEVHVDDPAARLDIPAWSRLSGNTLLRVVEEDAERTRFYLRKKV